MGNQVLISGFEPFAGDSVNPSELVVRSLAGHRIAGHALVGRVLPVETVAVRGRLEAMLREETPAVVLALGQAAGRSALAIERVAVNLLDFDVPDNVGTIRKNEPVERGGPDARLSNVPFASIADAWNEHEVPGYVSNTAGTFLCNQVLYELLALAGGAVPPTIVGFIHLPSLPSQAIAAGAQRHPSMSFELMKKGIEVAIETILANSQMWIPRRVKEVER